MTIRLIIINEYVEGFIRGYIEHNYHQVQYKHKYTNAHIIFINVNIHAYAGIST